MTRNRRGETTETVPAEVAKDISKHLGKHPAKWQQVDHNRLAAASLLDLLNDMGEYLASDEQGTSRDWWLQEHYRLVVVHKTASALARLEAAERRGDLRMVAQTYKDAEIADDAHMVACKICREGDECEAYPDIWRNYMRAREEFWAALALKETPHE